MLFTIDFLILNFSGDLETNFFSKSQYKDNDTQPFKLVPFERGTSIFKERYSLYQNEVLVGTVLAKPHSNIIAQDLIQIQFENNLFYTLYLSDLVELVNVLQVFYNMTLTGFNRIDIALDMRTKKNKYQNLISRILRKELKISGKDKKFTPHYETEKGDLMLTGFSVGSRTSSRFFRCYNKTLELKDGTKQYINEYHKVNGLEIDDDYNIWRLEYQLNGSFFTDKKNNSFDRKINFTDLDENMLRELFLMAISNHFEIKYNTGKSEINKERNYQLIDLRSLKSLPQQIVKQRKVFELSQTTIKRYVKGLFRHYYQKIDTLPVELLSKILTENKLNDWFLNKMNFYIAEFKNKEKITNQIDINEFLQTLEYYNEKHYQVNP